MQLLCHEAAAKGENRAILDPDQRLRRLAHRHGTLVVRMLDGIDMNVETVMQPSTTKQEPSETDFDRAKEEAFSNEGGAAKPDQDTPSPDAGEGNVARAEDHPDAVLAGVRFPAQRSGYPNNRITFDDRAAPTSSGVAAVVRRGRQG